MFSPNHITYGLAHKAREEQLRPATRDYFGAGQREPGQNPVSRVTLRRMTARRLAAGLAGVILVTFAAVVTGTAGATDAAPAIGGGAGMHLLR